MKVVNLTIELESSEEVLAFEHWLRDSAKVKDFQILPDTKELYENDSHFKYLAKKYYECKKLRNDYINEHNFRGNND